MPFTDPFVANPYPYAFSCTLPSTTNPGAPYEISGAFVSGVYTISWSGGGTLNVDFYNGTTLISTATGTSSITFNLAQSATKAVLWNTVAGVSVVISLTALAVSPVSGVLQTYTASGTPGLIGDAYVIVVGGGGGSLNSAGSPTGGGGSGGINGGRVALTGAETLTIGTAGVANGANGGSTIFAGFTATGGITANAGAGGAGGTPNGVAGGAGGTPTGGAGSPTVTAASFFGFLSMGSTGSGGGGGNGGANGPGGGSGIGTGGGSFGSATGYGAGASGASALGLGSNGTAGVCYVVLVA